MDFKALISNWRQRLPGRKRPVQALEGSAAALALPADAMQGQALVDDTELAVTNDNALEAAPADGVAAAQVLMVERRPYAFGIDWRFYGDSKELRQTLWQFIAKLNREGSTVLLTTHYLEEAEALCSRIAMLKQGKVVALDSTSELLKAASSNVLRFKLDGELPPALAAQARVIGRIVQLPAHDAADIERHLAAVREAGLQAQDVEIRKADLEDVFLDVMQHSEVAA